jgi:hypothetical protein
MNMTIDEQQMLLIMKYYDGECSEVEVLQAEKLIREEGTTLDSLMEGYAQLGSLMEEWGHTVEARTSWVPDIDLIMNVAQARALDNSSANNEVIDTRAVDKYGASKSGRGASQKSSLGRSKLGWSRWFGVLREQEFDLWRGIGWAVSGGLVTASLVLLFGLSDNFVSSVGERIGVSLPTGGASFGAGSVSDMRLRAISSSDPARITSTLDELSFVNKGLTEAVQGSQAAEDLTLGENGKEDKDKKVAIDDNK